MARATLTSFNSLGSLPIAIVSRSARGGTRTHTEIIHNILSVACLPFQHPGLMLY